MSNRTLVELNHDYADRVQNEPERFIEAIGDYVRGCSPEARELLRIYFGVTVFWTQHHSDTSRLTWSGGVAEFEDER